MQEIIEGWPFWAAFVFLFCVAMVRGNAVYWTGRGLRSGGDRSRLARHLDRPLVARAEHWVRRYGPITVTVGHLTVGVQSAITASAGMLRMPQLRFQAALAGGALLWAGLYTTVGLATVDTLLGRLPWWVGLVVVALVVALIAVSSMLRPRTPRRPGRSG